MTNGSAASIGPLADALLGLAREGVASESPIRTLDRSIGVLPLGPPVSQPESHPPVANTSPGQRAISQGPVPRVLASYTEASRSRFRPVLIQLIESEGVVECSETVHTARTLAWPANAVHVGSRYNAINDIADWLWGLAERTDVKLSSADCSVAVLAIAHCANKLEGTLDNLISTTSEASLAVGENTQFCPHVLHKRGVVVTAMEDGPPPEIRIAPFDPRAVSVCLRDNPAWSACKSEESTIEIPHLNVIRELCGRSVEFAART